MIKRKCQECGREWECHGDSMKYCTETPCTCIECFLGVSDYSINPQCFPKKKGWRIA